MAKKAKVWDGSAWQDLASAVADLTPYSTTAQMNTAINTNAGLNLITTSSFSSASAASIDNCFTSTYKHYKLLIKLTSYTSSDLTLRFRTGGVTNTSSSYTYAYFYIGSSFVASRGSSQTSSLLIPNIGQVAAIFSMDVFSPQESLHTYFTAPSGGSNIGNFANGSFDANTQFDGFSILGTSMTGTIQVYGYKN